MVPILNSRLLISGFVIIKKYKYTFNFWRLKIKRFSYITRDCVCLVSSVYKCFVIRSFRAIRVKCLYRHYCEFVIFPVQTTALGIGHFSFFVAQNTIYNRLYRIKHIEKRSESMHNLIQACQSYNSSYRPLQVFLVSRPRLHYAGEIWKRSIHEKLIKCLPPALRRRNLKSNEQSQSFWIFVFEENWGRELA